jgi:nicotinamidase-related amidase
MAKAKAASASSSAPRARGDGQALLVVDVQQGLFERPTPIFQAASVLANINGLVDQARRAGAPVVYIRHCDTIFLWEGTPGWQLHPAMAPAAADILLQKHHGNAFQDTSLGALLAERGIGTVVVTGLVTHGCVKATCRGALELGYRVVLAADGHSSYSKQAAAFIETWNRQAAAAGIEVLPAAKIRFAPAGA